MRHLVLGLNNDQLIDWARKHGCDYISHVKMIARKGSKEFHLLVSRPKDERVVGLTFQGVTMLEGITSVDVCYMARIR